MKAMLFIASLMILGIPVEGQTSCGDFKSRILFRMGAWAEDPPAEAELTHREVRGYMLLFDRTNRPANVGYISATMIVDAESGRLGFCYVCGYRFFLGKLIAEPKGPECRVVVELQEQEPVTRTVPPTDKMTLDCDLSLGAIVTCNKEKYLDNIDISNSGDVFRLFDLKVAKRDNEKDH